MPWRYHGRASPNPSSPEAQGQCARCGFYYQLRELVFQHQWRGQSLQNTWFRVCKTCLDVPSEFLKTIIIPADPPVVQYPQVPQVESQMNNTQTMQWDPPPTYPSIFPPTQNITIAQWDAGGNWDEG